MQGYTEKEILSDGLSTQKAATDKFNTSANECTHTTLRDTFMKILEQEHNIQYECMRKDFTRLRQQKKRKSKK